MRTHRLIPLFRPFNRINQALYMRVCVKLLSNSGVKIHGAPLWIAPSCRFDISDTATVELGHRCVISEGVSLLTHDYSMDRVFESLHASDDLEFEYYRAASISIGSRVFVGMNATILPGVDLGDGCLVAAGAVVTKSFEAGSVIGGNPATKITNIEELWQRSAGKFSRKRRRK
ncbi:MAG: acyltransferase [Gordonia polyisoprenivorans]|nr:acyltransferase [Gordonia polyisoprenivorans]